MTGQMLNVKTCPQYVPHGKWHRGNELATGVPRGDYFNRAKTCKFYFWVPPTPPTYGWICHQRMIDKSQFLNLRLPGNFVIKSIEFTRDMLWDALNREAIAQTRIVGREFRLLIRAGLSDQELSVTLYHEVLEAALVGSVTPPDCLLDFNEAAFEHAAQEAYRQWGDASPDNLRRLLQFHGFQEQ